MHLTSSSLDWYVARAGGIAAYLLLTGVVLFGLTMSSKRTLKRWPKFALEDVHRFGGLLVGTFTFVHVVAIAIDSYLPFSLAQVLVPLTASYRTLWTSLGIVAAELLLALAVTNHYRDRLSHRFWRRAHYLNFAVWAAASVHGLGAGTDRSTPWLTAIFVASVAAVVGATCWRALRSRLGAFDVAWVAAGTAACVALVVVLLAQGPLRFRPHRVDAAHFDASLSGQISRETGPTRGLVSLAGRAEGSQRVLLRADLLLAPGRLDATSFQMEYVATGTVCRGSVTHVESYAFDAVCRTARGPIRHVHAQWDQQDGDENSGTIDEGSLRVSA